MSIASYLHQLLEHDRSNGAHAVRYEQLDQQVRSVQTLLLKSASDLTSRIRRLETQLAEIADRCPARTVTTDGATFEDYDRYQLLTVVAYARDVAEHLVPDLAVNAEDRADREMDRVYATEAESETVGKPVQRASRDHGPSR